MPKVITENDQIEVLAAFRKHKGDLKKVGKELGLGPRQIRRRLDMMQSSAKELLVGKKENIKYIPQIGSGRGVRRWEIRSLPNNTFRLAAFGDLHAASKYCRWDVREDLTKRAEAFKAQAIIDTGNWIDGLKPFNLHDLEAIGLEAQCQLLAKKYPKTKIPTYAITGDDHEGWFIKTEGVDVGKLCEGVMQDYGHPWIDLGYLEADIVLRNYNTGKTTVLRVMHPGGGSAYAISYRPQKIIESFEGGEKPAVLFLGHYHKLDCGLIRNVWYIQTGTCQDQTPFLRKRAIETHVGGVLVELEQDPKTGGIVAFSPQVRRYYTVEGYFTTGKGNNRWSGHGPITQVPRA